MMDLINEMAESQKMQEMKFEELKTSVEKLQEELQETKLAKMAAEQLLKESECQMRQLQMRFSQLKEESDAANNLYKQEMNSAKQHCSNVERELMTTYEEIVNEMRRLEDKNQVLEEDLTATKEQLKCSLEREHQLNENINNMKQIVDGRSKEYSILCSENDKHSNELHTCKINLLKERNANNRLLDEVKRFKKELSSREIQLEEIKREKNVLHDRIEELVQVSTKDRLLEIELKDLKTIVNMIMIGNNAIDDKLTTVRSILKSEVASVGVQTQMTLSDLDQYANLDRQAMMMMMDFREQVVNLKQQYLESRQENDVLKDFVHKAKHEKEAAEEGERVGRLEETVRALTDLVRQEFYEPSKETSILKTLQDVKKDLGILKAKTTLKPQEAEVCEIRPQPQYDPSMRPVKLVTYRSSFRH